METVPSTSRFSIPDYVVFSTSLLASFGIGVYSAFAGKKKKTTEDFYFGNHDMNIVAVAMSLAATFLSAIGLLGVPSEVYRNGISYSVLLLSEITCGTLAIVLFIPFFYNLRMTSVYEYFEHRFNRTIRRCACLLFVTNMLLYMSVVLYAPALALSQVSGLPIWVSIISSGVICTIYTSLGGMKSVIWTDAFQMVVMLSGVLVVFIHGIISAGGAQNIVQANLNVGRLHVTFDPDPTVRHSFWALLIGGIFTILPFSMNQATVQRYLSVKNKRAAQRMMSIQLPTVILWWSILITVGLIMYTYYQGCDPEMAGRIERPDQMIAIFVGDVLGYLQGLPGLFTAVVYSATLSTVSSGVNSIVVVLTEDFIRPLLHLKGNTVVQEQTVMRITKGLSFVVGFVAIGLAFAASALGRQLIEFCLSIDGMCGGPLLGLFFCGMMLPYCNSKGAAVGVFCGLVITFWIGVGSILTAAPLIPLGLSTDLCPLINGSRSYSDAAASSRFVHSSHSPLLEVDIEGHVLSPNISRSLTALDWIYSISYQYYSVIGFTVTVFVATIVSYATGRQDPARIPDRFFLYNVFATVDKDAIDDILQSDPEEMQKFGNLKFVDSGFTHKYRDSDCYEKSLNADQSAERKLLFKSGNI